MSRVCYDCAGAVELNDLLCPHCASSSLTCGRARPTRAGSSSTLTLPHPWSVMGRWDVGGVVSLAGPPGSGKSTLAALTSPVLWLTFEQTPGQAAGMLRRVATGELPEIVELHESQALLRELHSVVRGMVVLDSLTAAAGLDEQVQIMKGIVRWARGGDRRALVIRGVTSDDSAAGRRQLDHQVDVTCVVQQSEDGLRRLSVEKNRFGPLQSSYFAIGAHGVASPSWPYSYSVEGKPGAYALHPYPMEGARWAGLLARRFGDTPEPGWASAGRVVSGYAGGRLVPADEAERRAFAERHGLRWLEA